MPPAAGSRPAMTLRGVDLPAPFGPVTMSASPFSSANPIPEKTVSPPRSPPRFSAISRILVRPENTVLPPPHRTNLPFDCLELFQEILYMRFIRANGRRGHRISAE